MITARPTLLRGDNFTPPTRTPWGGTRLLALKRDVPLAHRPRCVGESWEISVEPDFPSLTDDGQSLQALLATDPEAWLGVEADRGSTALLVKLLDAADDLSVQIHPQDDHAGLAPGEGGKPESWYVLDREPGAGLYLGLRDGVTREALAAALTGGSDVSALLGFVPVEPGDFFVIHAGTPHAIGRGVTLVEPQRVLPGRRGVTYRYWDWNRLYDAEGRRAEHGTPRALHTQQALDVTDWNAPREDALFARIRTQLPPSNGTAELVPLATPTVPAAGSPDLRVGVLRGSGTLPWDPRPLEEGANVRRLMGLTVVAGTVRIRTMDGEVHVGRGRSAVLPATLSDGELVLEDAHATLAAVT